MARRSLRWATGYLVSLLRLLSALAFVGPKDALRCRNWMMTRKESLKQTYLPFRSAVLSRLAVLFGTTANRNRPQPLLTEIKRILYIRNDRLGDLVLSLPSLMALRNHFPDARLTVLASRSNHTLLKGQVPVDETIVFDRRMRLKDRYAVIRSLQRRQFDLAIDPFTGPTLSPAVIAFLSRSKFRIGYPSFGREVFFNMHTSSPPPKQHFVDASLGILRPLGIGTAAREPRLPLTSEERAWGRKKLAKIGCGKKPIIGIHPGGHHWTQRWPETYFAELIDRLKDEKDPTILLFGGEGDRTIIEKILQGVRNKPMVHVPHDLRRFAAMVAHCKLFVCNNSGPLHLAGALDVQTVSFMGPTVKHRWFPVGPRHQVFRRDDLPCIGCNRGYCMLGTHECMRSIAPSEALKTCIALLTG